MEMQEITLYGNLSEDGKVFKVRKNVPYVPRSNKKYDLKRKEAPAKEVIGAWLKELERKTLMKIYNLNSGLYVVFFCDSEGRIYFLSENGERIFISINEKMGISEDGDYYLLYRKSGGIDMVPMEPLVEAFPFKIIGEKIDEFAEDFSGFIPIEEEDPFRSSNVINLDAYRFRNQGPRGR